jgi:hypothetical protein
MEERIMFHTPTTFLGRNGEFKAAGIIISTYGTATNLIPITSKGEQGRAMVSFPKEELPRVIGILTSML